MAGSRPDCDPMRGLKSDRTASVVTRGHGFIQNLRPGRYDWASVPRAPRPVWSVAGHDQNGRLGRVQQAQIGTAM